jgi:hypothetical protein
LVSQTAVSLSVYRIRDSAITRAYRTRLDIGKYLGNTSLLAAQCYNFGVEGSTMPLPDKFPPGTIFADVEGVPVAEVPGDSPWAWDKHEPRRFSSVSFDRNGTVVDEPAFRRLVARYQTSDKSRSI